MESTSRHDQSTSPIKAFADTTDAILRKQRICFSSGRTKPLAHRLELLEKLKEMVLANEEAIVSAIHKDLGKPKLEAVAHEIAPLIEEIRFTRKNLAKWMRPQKVATSLLLLPGRSRIHREPLGIVLIISPWNYPFLLAMMGLANALAAGNCVLVKPSELAPTVSALMKRLIGETFPPEIACVVEGGVSETTMLLRCKFDHIMFTGSTAVGRIVMQAAAQHLTPVTLELGGKSPAFVTASAVLDLAARRIAWGKFINSGQTCVAPDYVYVHESVAEEFLEKMKSVLREFFGPDAKASDSYSRIINERNFDRLTSLLERHQPYLGGQSDRSQRYIAPTLLTDASWSDPVMQEEIFGPILPVLRYSDLESTLYDVSQREKPLAAYLFTSERSDEKALLEKLSFGGGCINDTILHMATPHMPFGGVGSSGTGAYHGENGFLAFSHQKSVLYKSRFLDLALRYPPYTLIKSRWLRALFGIKSHDRP